jgi:CBS domain containing-hemolysin-like protein
VSGGTGLLIVAALVLANGVFVASEFALVTVRRPLIDERAGLGDRRARMVARELADVSYALSAAQFGITVTSLLVGYLAERTVGETLIRPLLAVARVPEEATLAVAIGLALLLSSTLQVVFGELVPKNLAVARPLGIALVLVPVTRMFGRVLRPLIRVFDAAAAGVARTVFRVEVAHELEPGQTLDEIAQIVAASSSRGAFTVTQTRLLERALELGDTPVASAMIPWTEVAWLPVGASLDDLRAAAAGTGRSRFPVVGADGVIGTAHVKDLLAVERFRHATTSVGEVASPVLTVPGTVSLRDLLMQMRRRSRTFALVVNEHGDHVGVVTAEDVLERLVGAIEDEHDPRPSTGRRESRA